jgi:LacI family transcriptional regulator
MLMDMIADPTAPLPQRILEADLVLGQSTGPAPAARSVHIKDLA